MPFTLPTGRLERLTFAAKLVEFVNGLETKLDTTLKRTSTAPQVVDGVLDFVNPPIVPDGSFPLTKLKTTGERNANTVLYGDGRFAALPTGTSSSGTTGPRPSWYAAGSPPGLPVATRNTFARDIYDRFVAYCFTQTGMPTGMPAGAWRVQVPDANSGPVGSTFSEGVAYGMLASAFLMDPGSPIFDSRARGYFDGLVTYFEFFRNARGLMSWRISATGTVANVSDAGGATDADEDIAMALIVAHRLFPTAGYGAKATALINAIRDHEFVPATHATFPNVMTNGDQWGFDADRYMPDYFAPAWYREFAKHTGDTRWDAIVAANYPRAQAFFNTNYSTGMVPDQSTRDGLQVPGLDVGTYKYGYNSIRYPWRIAADYVLNGAAATSVAGQMLGKLAAYGRNQAGPSISNLRAEYTLNGQSFASYTNLAFVQGFGAAAITRAEDAQFAADCMTFLHTNRGESSYFGTSLACMSALLMAGLMNPAISVAGTTTSTTTTGGTGTVHRGAYAAANVYTLNDVVTHLGSSWRALRNVTGVTPVEGLDWTIVAAKGDKGDPGAKGDPGTAGAKGDPGATGASGGTPRGPYVATTAYVFNDIVSHLGSSWRALGPVTGVTPVEGTSWTLSAAKGDAGTAVPAPATRTRSWLLTPEDARKLQRLAPSLPHQSLIVPFGSTIPDGSDVPTVQTGATAMKLRGGGPLVHTFNAAASTTGVGPADTGQATIAMRGVIGRTAEGRAYVPTAGENIIGWNMNASNGYIEVLIGEPGGTDPGLGLMLRTNADASTGYFFQIDPRPAALSGIGPAIHFYRRSAGAFTEIGTAAVTPVLAGDVFAAELVDAVLRFYRNDTQIATFTDPTPLGANTHAAVRVTEPDVRLDDVIFGSAPLARVLPGTGTAARTAGTHTQGSALKVEGDLWSWAGGAAA